MDNGLYAVSLIPKDGENEEQQFCMEQERKDSIVCWKKSQVNPAKLITSKAVSRQNDCMDNMENVKATFAAKLEPKWIAYGSKMKIDSLAMIFYCPENRFRGLIVNYISSPDSLPQTPPGYQHLNLTVWPGFP